MNVSVFVCPWLARSPLDPSRFDGLTSKRITVSPPAFVMAFTPPSRISWLIASVNFTRSAMISANE